MFFILRINDVSFDVIPSIFNQRGKVRIFYTTTRVIVKTRFRFAVLDHLDLIQSYVLDQYQKAFCHKSFVKKYWELFSNDEDLDMRD